MPIWLLPAVVYVPKLLAMARARLRVAPLPASYQARQEQQQAELLAAKAVYVLQTNRVLGTLLLLWPLLSAVCPISPALSKGPTLCRALRLFSLA